MCIYYYWILSCVYVCFETFYYCVLSVFVFITILFFQKTCHYTPTLASEPTTDTIWHEVALWCWQSGYLCLLLLYFFYFYVIMCIKIRHGMCRVQTVEIFYFLFILFRVYVKLVMNWDKALYAIRSQVRLPFMNNNIIMNARPFIGYHEWK